MKVYAIIVVYNGMQHDWIQKCFDSIMKATIPVSIIAIDNGSTDGSIAFIKQNYPDIDFIESARNLGFGQANNVGIRKAYMSGADYVFLLNQDAWAKPDTIEKLVITHQTNEQYGILSPMHLNGSGAELDLNFSNYIAPAHCPGLYSDVYMRKFRQVVYDVTFVNAAAWLLNKKCIENVGGFSPLFFHYGEDINYCQRVHFHGLKVGVVPTVEIVHDREQVRSRTHVLYKDVSWRAELLRLSNPFTPLSFFSSVAGYIKDFIKASVKLNFAKAYDSFLNIKRLYLSAGKVKKYFYDSQQQGLTFLTPTDTYE